MRRLARQSGHDRLGTADGPAVEDLLNGGTLAVSAAFRESLVDPMCGEQHVKPVVLDASIVSILGANGPSTTCAVVSSAIQQPR